MVTREHVNSDTGNLAFAYSALCLKTRRVVDGDKADVSQVGLNGGTFTIV
jgi:hypothetical protein